MVDGLGLDPGLVGGAPDCLVVLYSPATAVSISHTCLPAELSQSMSMQARPSSKAKPLTLNSKLAICTGQL